MAGQAVNDVDAIFCSFTNGGASELSHYACGLACQNLSMGIDMLFDYSSEWASYLMHRCSMMEPIWQCIIQSVFFSML